MAARIGHDVTLIERRPRVGGQIRLAASVDGRGEIGGVVTHLEGQVAKLGVDLRLGWAPTVGEITALAPDHVIIATGSAPAAEIVGNIARGVWDTPGLDLDHVLNVWDVLEHGATVGHNVLVADDGEGGWKAIGLALQLANHGHAVQLSSPLPYVAAKIGPFSRNRLIPRIFASGIRTREFASIVSVTPSAVTISERGHEVVVEEIDSVILAGWHRPVADLYFECKAAGVPVDRVGDAVASRTTFEAVHEGERAARRI